TQEREGAEDYQTRARVPSVKQSSTPRKNPLPAHPVAVEVGVLVADPDHLVHSPGLFYPEVGPGIAGDDGPGACQLHLPTARGSDAPGTAGFDLVGIALHVLVPGLGR